MVKTVGIQPRLIAIFLALLCVINPVFAEPLSGGNAEIPAAQSELSQQGRSLKVNIFGPIKGLATNVADTARDGDYAKVLDNLHMLKRGVWSTRGTGVTKADNDQFNSGARMLNMAPVTNVDGDFNLVIQAGGTVYSYNPATGTATSEATGKNATAIPDIRGYEADKVYWCNGVDDPMKWDGDPGTGFSTIGTWPVTISSIQYDLPKYQESFAGRWCLAGFPARPHSVIISNSSYDYVFAGAITFPAHLGRITGMRTLRLDTTSNETVLLIGCERGMAIITGNSDSTFEGLELTREFGLLSHRSWLQIGNDMYFMATDGIRRISSSLGTATLAIAPLTFGLQDVIDRINTAQKEKIFVVHHPESQEAIWFVPIDSDTDPDNAIVMNYNVEPTSGNAIASTSVEKPLFSTMSGLTAISGVYAGGTAYIGTTDGYLKQMFSGDTFDGTAIAWSYVTPLVGANSPAQSLSMKKTIIITEGATQKFDVQAYSLETMSTGVTKWIPQDSAAFNISGSSVADIATWASGNTSSYPKLIDFHSKGSGRFWAIKLSGDATDEHIDLTAIQTIMTIGGWRE